MRIPPDRRNLYTEPPTFLCPPGLSPLLLSFSFFFLRAPHIPWFLFFAPFVESTRIVPHSWGTPRRAAPSSE
ncbi:MAG: hypothetical protein D6679_04975 [Candidatus Hydrogenedentota bacterium]|nr:MAG: hypothetical protein D6679_04975 [Candidatus Hydrogenedentota bacterium]